MHKGESPFGAEHVKQDIEPEVSDMKRLALLSVATVAGLIAGLTPANATLAATQENVRQIANIPGTTGGDVAIQGNRLYMGNYGIGFSIYDITNPRLPVQVGQYRPTGLRADATVDSYEADGKKVAVLGGDRAGPTTMTEFVDVTTPATPVVLQTMTSTQNGGAHNVDIVDERGLYLPSGGGFRIFNITGVTKTPSTAPTSVFNGNLYTLWNSSPFRQGRPLGQGFTHIHDIKVYTDLSVLLPEAEWVDQNGDEIPDPTFAPKDIAFVAEGGDYVGGNNRGTIFVVDITNPALPVVRNRFIHPTGAGHHPWRYMHEVQLLDGDPHIGLATDEDLHNGCTAGGVMSLRFSEDYTTAVELDEWFIGSAPAAVCSAHVFSSDGNYVFMGSYNAGLQVIDFTDPADLKRAGQYIAEGANSWGALYHQGVVYAGDFGGRGLDVFEFIPEPNAKAILKASNPASSEAPGGISEIAAACDPGSEADGIDGLWVDVPAEKRDGTGFIRALGSSEAPYDVDVWFYDATCNLLPGQLANVLTGDEQGPIPAGANYAVVNMWAGAPQWVYAKIT
jgi:hypothetical protein